MLGLDDFPRWAYEVAFASYAIIVTGVVLLERRKPTATLALVLALIFLPVVGLIAYLVFSRQRVRRRQRQRARRPIDPVEGTRNIASLETLPPDAPPMQRGLVQLALRTAAAPLRRADEVVLLDPPDEAWEATCEAISQATRTLHLEFYIWKDDETGRALVELLAQRAREGVRVRVLVDHFGSFGLSNSHFAPLTGAGGRVAIFGRLRIPIPRARLNFRNHRKIITVDGCVGFIGGLNVGNEYFHAGEARPVWRDTWIRMSGDAVVGLEAIFLDDWLASTGEVVDLEGQQPQQTHDIDARRPTRKPRAWRRRDERERRLRAANPFAPLPDRPVMSVGPLLQIIPSGPDIPVGSSIAAQFSAAIASAFRRAWIATPYFVPDEALLLILRTAALRGVDVRILVPDPAKNDARLVALASRSYYDELLEAGARIYEYQPGMLHSKYMVVDDIAAVGSANMDVRSFHLNYEVTAMFYDARVAERLAEEFEQDLGHADEIEPVDRLRLSLGARFLEGFARVWSPLM